MKSQLRFIGWFFFANALLFFLVSCRYVAEILPFSLAFPTPLNECLVSLFMVFAVIGHGALLAFLPSIFVLPFLLCTRQLLGVQVVAVGVSSLALWLLIIDTFIFQQFHYHLNGIILRMLFSTECSEVFQLSTTEWLLIAGLGCVILALEIVLAYLIAKLTARYSALHGKVVGVSLATCLLFAYQIFLLSSNNLNLSLTQQARALPLFNNFLATLIPLPDSLTRVEILGSNYFIQPKSLIKSLHYPLKPLHFQPPAKPFNLLFIVIDTWRFDELNSLVTPNLDHFSKKSWQFMNHWSGGNSTQAGMFSLFYGLPGTYWSSMLAAQQGPVLIKALRDKGYPMGVYASAELTLPALNRTVFADVSQLTLQTQGETPYLQDQTITQKFFHFLDGINQRKKPFFSVLFYNAAHAYCNAGNPIHHFQPEIAVCKRYELTNDSDPIPYLNRYKNALFFVDQQIGLVLKKLDATGQLKNTVIVITGDHGQEFNDNHQGYWEHASNYTKYQVQTPLLVYWPGEKPAKFTHWTSHFDLTPTLMKSLLGCKNPASDFCIGYSLLDKRPRNHLVISSYIDFGIIEPNQITNIYATGNYAVHDLTNRLLPSNRLHYPILVQAFTEMNNFYNSSLGKLN